MYMISAVVTYGWTRLDTFLELKTEHVKLMLGNGQKNVTAIKLVQFRINVCHNDCVKAEGL